jgi:hypothetical protein
MAEDPVARQSKVQRLLEGISWDRTWTDMHDLIVRTAAQSDPSLSNGTSRPAALQSRGTQVDPPPAVA